MQLILLNSTRLGAHKKTPRRVTMEFHINRKSRDFYEFDQELFSISGNVVFANFLATRIFAKKINDKRDIATHPQKAVLPGQLNAMGLIDEILHYVAELYREETDMTLFRQALDYLQHKLGSEQLDRLLHSFVEEFPGIQVYRGEISARDFLAGETEGISHREIIMEEILLLWLANMNPAFGPFLELFDDSNLKASTVYGQFAGLLHEFFEQKPKFGPDNQNIIDMLRAPAIAVPNSLQGQLQYMIDRWGMLLGKFLMRLLSSLDYLKEEARLFWKGGFSKEGYDSALTYSDVEIEAFSPDKDWMPKVILIAKSTLVWLDQLSKKYQRHIQRLDEIPDEELDILARRGFNALWFIGLWERSKASKRIKQMCGNPEAEASAYSLYDYDIAWELGGWEALNNLRERAWRRGIRLAADMVPNHTGIDSKWMSEHPDRFLQLPYSPYPNYTFNGPDLSQDPNIEVKIEDHYYDRSDAAVTFFYRHKHTGQVRHIYHGNDGTSMPWNDTAQLNFLNPETREAVIQVILHVARNFPIIRFDAAMTLAKKHIQRLWFPLPGSGGDIASRAEHAMTREDFDRAIPVEFWREVVDRVALEVPDTLLLAEAFWMMEGYFVRTLGMHRVYNSAFMHMFKKEDNEKYRYTIKNTLEFDPEILKRFVNFMNNPDEETAAVQFGTGDKYFGVATMMATMPGTPMFGHGQIEGFREKYGMEYRRAYWDEKEDHELIARHEREIFPLLHKRYLFAEVKNFYLYDLWAPEGHVNQNVFAFSNGHGGEYALVLYNNSYSKAIGWIRMSAGYAIKKPDGTKEIVQKDLGSALQLHHGSRNFVVLRELNSNLWFVRRSDDLLNQGMYVDLNGYQKQVFLDIHEVYDADGRFERLHNSLGGAGCEDIEEAIKQIEIPAVYAAFDDLFNPGRLVEVLNFLQMPEHDDEESLWRNLEARLLHLTFETKAACRGKGDSHQAAVQMRQELSALEELLLMPITYDDDKSIAQPLGIIDTRFRSPSHLPYSLYAYSVLLPLGLVTDFKDDLPAVSLALIEDWYLDRRLRRFLTQTGMHPGEARHLVDMMRLCLELRGWFDMKLVESDLSEKELAGVLLEKAMSIPGVRVIFGENVWEGNRYINKEGFEYALLWFLSVGCLDIIRREAENASRLKWISRLHQILNLWRAVAEKQGYNIDNMLQEFLPKRKTVEKIQIKDKKK